MANKFPFLSNFTLGQSRTVESWRRIHTDAYILKHPAALSLLKVTKPQLAAYLLRNPKRSDSAA